MKRKITVAFLLIFAVFTGFGLTNLRFTAIYAGNSPAAVDNTIVKTYGKVSDSINPPTVVCDVAGSKELDSLTSGSVKPSNAILRLDGEANVVGANGEVLGAFEEIYKTALNQQIIPILYLQSEAAADSAIQFLSSKIDILDLAVMSDQPDLVKKVKTANSKIRGIVECKEESDAYQIVKTANLNLAMTAVIPQSKATRSFVDYIQGRFKAVWVRPDSLSKSDLAQCIGSGAYGIVADEFTKVTDMLAEHYSNAIFRTPFNVAHRGLPKKNPENSLSGSLAAMQAGATHLELDCYLSADKEIVIMHDITLDRTTNGTGNIETMTLAQIRKYKLDGVLPEEIPTLDDILGAMNGKDCVLVLEIKSKKTEIVQIIKKKIAERKFYNRLTVISFHQTILAEMRQTMPEVPTANLNAASADNFADVLRWMGEYNTGVDTTIPADRKFNEKYLKDRGILGWYWTFNGDRPIIDAIGLYGYVGVTNNDADVFSKLPRLVRGLPFSSAALTESGSVAIEAVMYGGDVKQVEGSVILLEDKGNYYNVFASFDATAYRIRKLYLSQCFRVYKEGTVSPSEILTRADALIEDIKKTTQSQIDELKSHADKLVQQDRESFGVDEKLAQLSRAFAERKTGCGGSDAAGTAGVAGLSAILFFARKRF